MKVLSIALFTVLGAAGTAAAAATSSSSSRVRGGAPAQGAEAADESEAASSTLDTSSSPAANTENDNNEHRNLQSNKNNNNDCDRTLWRPNYNRDWSVGTCSQNGNCNWSGYSSELACCKAAYSGQPSGACLQSLPNPPTTSPTKEGGMDVFYPDYDTNWSDATCKNDYPLPNGRPTYSSQLACCKGAYAGQASGACLAALPSPPTSSPTMEGGAAFYYPMYEEQWSEGYCSNDLPLPFTPGGRPTYDSQLECCKGAYSGQMSGKCLQMLPNPPTTSPTAEGGAAFYYPKYEMQWSEAYCTNELPLPFTTGGRPTYDSMLECCKGAYAGQASGACLQMLPSPPTTSPTAVEGPWYPDRSQDWASATCSNDYPTNYNEATYDSQEECCKGVYGNQDSDACMCDVDPCHSCKCFGIASARQKIIDAVETAATDVAGSPITLTDLELPDNEFFFKMYCTNPSPNPLTIGGIAATTFIPNAGGGTNPDLTFDDCCNNWSGTDDACMCKSEPCYSCQCRDTVAETNLALIQSAPNDPDQYDFHEYCIGNAVGGVTIANFVKNADLEQCYEDPTKQPTPAPTKARRLGEVHEAPAVI